MLVCIVSLLGLLLISGPISSQEPEPQLTTDQTALARKYILFLESRVEVLEGTAAYTDSIHAEELAVCRDSKGLSTVEILAITGTVAGVTLLIAWSAFKLGVAAD